MIKTLKCLCLISILSSGFLLLTSLDDCVVQASVPSVPEFTVKLVAYPYDVPTTTSTKIDPYTGNETVITTPGYTVENRSIEIWIKNQPFTPYTDDWKDIDLYYDLQVKGHFEEDWKKVYSKYKSSDDAHPVQSSSEYTILSLPANYPDGGLVDFKVRALLGYYYDELAGRPILPLYALGYVGSSDWSNTQTLTIQNPEIIPEFSSWIVLPLFLIVTLSAIAIRKKSNR